MSGWKPYDYQLPAIDFACNMLLNDPDRFCCLWMEMRTGKTPTVLFVAQRVGVKTALFITKKKAKHGVKKTDEQTATGIDLTVVNYESLHKLPADYRPELVVVDESHRLGSFPKKAVAAGMVRDIIQRCAPMVVFLSGTPTPESYSQIYHQMWVLGNRSPFSGWPTFYRWAETFVNVTDKKIRLKPTEFAEATEYYFRGAEDLKKGRYHYWTKEGEWTGPDGDPVAVKPEYISYMDRGETKVRGKKREIATKDYSDAQWDLIEPYVSRYFFTLTQKEAGFESIVDERHIYVENPPAIKGLCEHVMKHDGFRAKAGWTIEHATVGTKMQKIHQICSGTILAIDRDGNKIHVTLSEHKVAPIREMYDRGMKLVIFYHFVAEFEMLKKHFPDWTSDERTFEENERRPYLAQFVKDREGINLSSGDAIVMLNVPFSATSYKQSMARMSVKDREKPTPVYWVVSRDGMDLHILETVRGKEDYTSVHFRKKFMDRHKQQVLFS